MRLLQLSLGLQLVALSQAFPAPDPFSENDALDPLWVRDAPPPVSKPFNKSTVSRVYYDGFSNDADKIPIFESAFSTILDLARRFVRDGVDHSFLTWFDLDDRDLVNQVHELMLRNLDPDYEAEHYTVKKVWMTTKDVYGKCSANEDLATYTTHFSEHSSTQHVLPSRHWMNNDDCIIHFCEPWIKTYKMWEERFKECSDLPSNHRINDDLDTIWSLLFHELIHCRSIGDQAMLMLDPSDEKPILGRRKGENEIYGPYNCMEAAQDCEGMAVRNPTNYEYHALNRYWNDKCPFDLREPSPEVPPKSSSLAGNPIDDAYAQ